MNLYDNSTYPPHTTQPPPSTPTASTGFPASTDLFSLILVLVVVGVVALAFSMRLASRARKGVSRG